jgi:hypothetical protein
MGKAIKIEVYLKMIQLCKMNQLFYPISNFGVLQRYSQFHASRAMTGSRRQIELSHAQHDVAACIRL